MYTRTTAEWLVRVESDRKELEAWLAKQYRGEVRAAVKVAQFADTIEDHDLWKAINSIADDEHRHARWIGALMIIEGIEIDADQDNADNRYWREIVDREAEITQDEMLAAGAHAELMRLERIAAVMNSKVLDPHITKVFARIYTDEQRHAKIFSEACSPEAFAKMSEVHKRGLVALGLEI